MRTLEIQGGPMSKDEVNAFERLPFFEDAIRIRRWDEAGKLSAMDTLSFNHFMQLAEEHLQKNN
jgi:predicted HD phosphohydrolase